MNSSRILIPGKNCWRIEFADRISLLIDGADYFHAFREAAKQAQRSILIIGWDINSRLKLEQNPPPDNLPIRLKGFLNSLVIRKKNLHIHILDWDFALIFASGREWLPQYKMAWTTHPHLHFRLDSKFPVGASQHQKIVVIDDRLAFVGGLDFALGRWDTPEHQPNDPRRSDLNTSVPQPYHDVQLMVSGNIAAALGELARERWRKATGQTLETPKLSADNDPWPAYICPELSRVKVGIARTYPKYKKQRAVREIEQLLLDAIGAARQTIYIENQYFTSHKIGQALIDRLGEEKGPEIVLILPQQTVGWLSQNTMDVLRERLLKQLYAADQFGRLRVYYPYLPGLGTQCIIVHTKILIIDDELLRVGSANFNNRSMGLDSECDLAIEALGEARIQKSIAHMRNRLLGEHLDVAPSTISKTFSEQASLIKAIESLTSTSRTLKQYEFRVSDALDKLIPDAQIADPELPFDGDGIASQLVREDEKSSTKRTLFFLASILVATLLLAAGWRWTPLGDWLDIRSTFTTLKGLQGTWLALGLVLGIYLIGGILIFPITLLITTTGMVFGAVYGFVYALLGTLLSAFVTYTIGHYLGRDTIQNLSHHWVARINQRLEQQGLLAIITLRVVPVAPFSIINLVAGASNIRLRDFTLATLLGMTPGILALTLFSDQIISAIQMPEAKRIAILFTLAILIAAATWALSRWLFKLRDTHDHNQD